MTADLTTLTVEVLARDGTSKIYTIVFDKVDALFFDDFSSPTLGPLWSGTGSLSPVLGTSGPSLSLASGQILEYVGTSVSTASGVTADRRRAARRPARARITLFDSAVPRTGGSRVELYQNGIHCQYGNGGSVVQDSQGPISANDHLFHRLEIQINTTGTATFRLDGLLRDDQRDSHDVGSVLPLVRSRGRSQLRADTTT